MNSHLLSEYLSYYATADLLSELPQGAEKLLASLRKVPPENLVTEVSTLVQSLIVHRGSRRHADR